MVKRKSPKAKTRKAVRRPVKRKKASRKKPARGIEQKVVAREISESPEHAVAQNLGAYWNVYRELQKKIDQAWVKLRSDVKKKASSHVILEDRNNLMLLLGECNYMAEECKRIINKK